MTHRLLTLAIITLSATEAVGAAPVDFNRDIKPILAHRCFECHGKDKDKGKLRLDSRVAILKGGREGPAIVVGKGKQSALIVRVSTADADAVMPPKGPRLTANEVALLRTWIDQGAKWGDTQVIDRGPPPSVAPRAVELPTSGPEHPIDRLLAGYFARHKIAPGEVVSDEIFLRRVYLDAVGLLPTPAEVAAFQADQRPDKRSRLVESLLGDNRRYTDHWITFWQDHLRDGKKDLGTTDVFRPITPWLEQSLLTNKPVDTLVRELVDPPNASLLTGDRAKAAEQGLKDKQLVLNDSVGFLFGLQGGLEVPRGDQAWQVQGVQNLAQVFMGVQLKCATCHDSFLDRWTMDETWALASIYTDKPLEVTRCEVPTGRRPEPRFLFPEVGKIDASAPVAERRAQLARLMTSPKNGRFPRTIVNRLWAKVMGRGIIATLDDMSQQPFDADLLDWLANDLVEHRYDLKRTLRLILTSQAYQRSAREEEDDAAPFRGPLVRRLAAEEFVDAVSALTGRNERCWHKNGDRLLEVLGRPDRRTVLTSRLSRSSPLQALELLNGVELHELIYAGKPKIDSDANRLIERIFKQALCRQPTARERAVCLDILGKEPTAKEYGDLVWTLVMLPEFQLVR